MAHSMDRKHWPTTKVIRKLVLHDSTAGHASMAVQSRGVPALFACLLIDARQQTAKELHAWQQQESHAAPHWGLR
jgi:hypothetical protein